MIDKTCYVLKGNVPSKKNSKRFIWRGRKKFLVPSEAHEVWHVNACIELKKQKPLLIENVNQVHLKFYPATKHRSDLSNKAESVMDLLVDMKVLADDNWFEVPRLDLEFCGIDKINPRCEIIIYS